MFFFQNSCFQNKLWLHLSFGTWVFSSWSLAQKENFQLMNNWSILHSKKCNFILNWTYESHLNLTESFDVHISCKIAALGAYLRTIILNHTSIWMVYHVRSSNYLWNSFCKTISCFPFNNIGWIQLPFLNLA